MTADPGRIVVAGDWHGNTRWACHVIEEAAEAVEGEENKIILQLGDFLPTYYYDPGRITPERRRDLVLGYLWTLEQMLRRYEMQLWFVDGNHEDWSLLNEAADASWDGDGDAWPEPIQVSERVYWLPRGCRWQWHGREWLAFGGAVSPNKVHLHEGWNWWPDEAITAEQVMNAISAGHADVVVSHDVPSGVHIQYPEVPRSWRRDDLDASDRNRGRLQVLADGVQSHWWMHGHHHIPYAKPVGMRHGTVEVAGLAADGIDLNWLVLDTKTMEWQVRRGVRKIWKGCESGGPESC